MVYAWANYIRMGTFASVLYTSCVFMALQFPPDAVKAAKKEDAEGVIYLEYVNAVMISLIGILPAFAVGVLASFFRLRYFTVTIVNRFRCDALMLACRNRRGCRPQAGQRAMLEHPCLSA